MVVAGSIQWGFALATVPARPSAHGSYVLVHVPGLTQQVQFCRIELVDAAVLVVFLAGAGRDHPDVAAMTAQFPQSALIVVFEDTRDRSRAFAIGTVPITAAATVAIAKCNGSLDDPWPMIVEVDAESFEAIAGFRGRQWYATVRAL